MTVAKMDRRRNHAGGCGGGHAREITVAARRHALNIESREAPRAASDEKETDEPAELGQVQGFGSVGSGDSANSPGVGEKCGGDAETHHVGERIEFPAEGAFGFHGAGDAAVHGVEKIGDADGACGVIEIGDFSVEGRQNRVIAAKHVSDGAGAGQNVNTTAQTMTAELTAWLFFLTDGIYVVEFHFAITLSPPFRCCPRWTSTCVSRGNQTSTREPKRIRPTRSPITTSCPSSFQHITRRAIAPAICLKMTLPCGVCR